MARPGGDQQQVGCKLELPSSTASGLESEAAIRDSSGVRSRVQQRFGLVDQAKYSVAFEGNATCPGSKRLGS